MRSLYSFMRAHRACACMLCMCVCVCICVVGALSTCGRYVEVKEQLAGIGSLLSPCVSWGSNPGHQVSGWCPYPLRHFTVFF